MKKLILTSLLVTACIHMNSQYYDLPKIYNGRKHRGFYLSIAAGINNTNISVASKNYGNSTFKGPGGGMDLKIGGTIKENLILHATLMSHGVTGPTIDNNYWGVDDVKADNKVTISEGMFGIGMTYYTPENILLSASLGFGGFTFKNEREDISFSTDNGFSFQLKAGKEWWISPKWAIGVAAYYHNTNSLNQEGKFEEEKIKSHNLGLVLNLTMNGRK